jgi:endonuclease/exonuclease/phosphatase family metal-dependent hydrolase
MHPDAAGLATFTAFKDVPDQDIAVIDHILLDSRWRVIDAGIERRKFGPLWPSDHFPVWAIVNAQ